MSIDDKVRYETDIAHLFAWALWPKEGVTVEHLDKIITHPDVQISLSNNQKIGVEILYPRDKTRADIYNSSEPENGIGPVNISSNSDMQGGLDKILDKLFKYSPLPYKKDSPHRAHIVLTNSEHQFDELYLLVYSGIEGLNQAQQINVQSRPKIIIKSLNDLLCKNNIYRNAIHTTLFDKIFLMDAHFLKELKFTKNPAHFISVTDISNSVAAGWSNIT